MSGPGAKAGATAGRRRGIDLSRTILRARPPDSNSAGNDPIPPVPCRLAQAWGNGGATLLIGGALGGTPSTSARLMRVRDPSL